MITPKMAEALNKQLNEEYYSAYLYLAMSAYASHKGLKGAANWLNVQYQEEMTHAEKFYAYIESQGAQVVLDAIAKPPAEHGSLLDLYKAVLEHEQKITANINELASLASGEGDHATWTFLQWFVTEQTEEEESARDIIDRLKLAGDTGLAIFMIDNELASRTFTAPVE